MRVEYFVKIIKELLKTECTEVKIAKTLGISRTAVTTILGKNSNQEPPDDLKSKHLRGLVSLCKEYEVEEYDTWNKLGKAIESELKLKKK